MKALDRDDKAFFLMLAVCMLLFNAVFFLAKDVLPQPQLVQPLIGKWVSEEGTTLEFFDNRFRVVYNTPYQSIAAPGLPALNLVYNNSYVGEYERLTENRLYLHIQNQRFQYDIIIDVAIEPDVLHLRFNDETLSTLRRVY